MMFLGVVFVVAGGTVSWVGHKTNSPSLIVGGAGLAALGGGVAF